MKKKVLAVLTVVLCLAILGDVTAAYFTARDTAHNVITTGNVTIKVEETQKVNGTEVPYPEGPIKGVMPGTSVSKIARVKNTGTGDAWVSVRVAKDVHFAEEVDQSGQHEDPEKVIEIVLNEKDWTRKGDWYYYNKPVAPGESTTPLFEKVSFTMQMGNSYQGATVNVNVFAEGVQSKNNPIPKGGTVCDIPGWPTAR